MWLAGTSFVSAAAVERQPKDARIGSFFIATAKTSRNALFETVFRRWHKVGLLIKSPILVRYPYEHLKNGSFIKL